MKEIFESVFPSNEGNIQLLTLTDYVEKHLESDLLVNNLISMVGISESTMLRLFRKNFGQTPREYIRKKRLQKAKELLLTGCFSVIQVGMMVGYSNPCSFSRAFHKEHGISPSHCLP